MYVEYMFKFFFFQAEDGIRYTGVSGVQTCALPISFEPVTVATSFKICPRLEFEASMRRPLLSQTMVASTGWSLAGHFGSTGAGGAAGVGAAWTDGAGGWAADGRLCG